MSVSSFVWWERFKRELFKNLKHKRGGGGELKREGGGNKYHHHHHHSFI